MLILGLSYLITTVLNFISWSDFEVRFLFARNLNPRPTFEYEIIRVFSVSIGAFMNNMFDIVATFFREFELEEMIIGTQVLVTKIWATRNQSLLPFIDFL